MTFKCNPLDVYFHMTNHYKKLKTVKSVVDTSAPPGYYELAQRRSRPPSRSERCRNFISSNNSHQITKFSNFNKENVPSNKLTRSHSLPPRPPTRRRTSDSGSSRKKYAFRAQSHGPSSIDSQISNPKPFLSSRSCGYNSTTDSFYTVKSQNVGRNQQFSLNINGIHSKLNTRPVPIPKPRHSKLTSHRTFLIDHDYLQFILRITEDIIRNDLYTSENFVRVFNSHIEANRGRLDEAKMVHQIQMLSKELNIPSELSSDQTSNNKEQRENTRKRVLKCTCSPRLKPGTTSIKTCECESVRCSPLKCALHVNKNVLEVSNIRQNLPEEEDVNRPNSSQGAIEGYIKIPEEQQCDCSLTTDEMVVRNAAKKIIENVKTHVDVIKAGCEIDKEFFSSCCTLSTNCDKDSLENQTISSQKKKRQAPNVTQSAPSPTTSEKDSGFSRILENSDEIMAEKTSDAHLLGAKKEETCLLDCQIQEGTNEPNIQQAKLKTCHLQTSSSQTSEVLLTMTHSDKSTRLSNIRGLESNNENKEEFILISGPIYIPKNCILLNNLNIAPCVVSTEPRSNKEEITKSSQSCKLEKIGQAEKKDEEKVVDLEKDDVISIVSNKTNVEDGQSSVKTHESSKTQLELSVSPVETDKTTYSQMHKAVLASVHCPSVLMKQQNHTQKLSVTESYFLNPKIIANLQEGPSVVKKSETKTRKHKSKSTALDKLNEYDLTPQRDISKLCNCDIQGIKCSHKKNCKTNERLLLGDEYEIKNALLSPSITCSSGKSDRIKQFYPDVATQTVSADFLLPPTTLQSSDSPKLSHLLVTQESDVSKHSKSLVMQTNDEPKLNHSLETQESDAPKSQQLLVIKEWEDEPKLPRPSYTYNNIESQTSVRSEDNSSDLEDESSTSESLEETKTETKQTEIKPTLAFRKSLNNDEESTKILKKVVHVKNSQTQEKVNQIRHNYLSALHKSEDLQSDSINSNDLTELQVKHQLHQFRKSSSKRSSEAFSKLALLNDSNKMMGSIASLGSEKKEKKHKKHMEKEKQVPSLESQTSNDIKSRHFLDANNGPELETVVTCCGLKTQDKKKNRYVPEEHLRSQPIQPTTDNSIYEIEKTESIVVPRSEKSRSLRFDYNSIIINDNSDESIYEEPKLSNKDSIEISKKIRINSKSFKAPAVSVPEKNEGDYVYDILTPTEASVESEESLFMENADTNDKKSK